MKATFKTALRNTETHCKELKEMEGELIKGFFIYHQKDNEPKKYYMVDLATGLAIIWGSKKALLERLDNYQGDEIMQKYEEVKKTEQYASYVRQYQEMMQINY